jgi:hypothetical protein
MARRTRHLEANDIAVGIDLARDKHVVVLLSADGESDGYRCAMSLSRYANTNSATIPLTIVSGFRERIQSEEMNLLLCGFGVGLSWATVLCRTDRIACPEIIER